MCVPQHCLPCFPTPATAITPPWAPTPCKPHKGILGLGWGGATPHQPAVCPSGKLVLGPPPRVRDMGTTGSDRRGPTRLHSREEHLAHPRLPTPRTWRQFVLSRNAPQGRLGQARRGPGTRPARTTGGWAMAGCVGSRLHPPLHQLPPFTPTHITSPSCRAAPASSPHSLKAGRGVGQGRGPGMRSSCLAHRHCMP